MKWAFSTGNGGIREKRDGKPLVVTLEYSLGETPKQITVDLVTAHWREVGLHVNSRQIRKP